MKIKSPGFRGFFVVLCSACVYTILMAKKEYVPVPGWIVGYGENEFHVFRSERMRDAFIKRTASARVTEAIADLNEWAYRPGGSMSVYVVVYAAAGHVDDAACYVAYGKATGRYRVIDEWNTRYEIKLESGELVWGNAD